MTVRYVFENGASVESSVGLFGAFADFVVDMIDVCGEVVDIQFLGGDDISKKSV